MHNIIMQNSVKYLDRNIIDVKEDVIRLKVTFFTLNILFILGTLATTLLTTILISGIWLNSFPVWFYYTTTGISAFTTFFTSIINFFVIKEKYLLRSKQLVELEILKLNNINTRKDSYNVFIKAASILENKQAMSEDQNE